MNQKILEKHQKRSRNQFGKIYLVQANRLKRKLNKIKKIKLLQYLLIFSVLTSRKNKIRMRKNNLLMRNLKTGQIGQQNNLLNRLNLHKMKWYPKQMKSWKIHWKYLKLHPYADLIVYISSIIMEMTDTLTSTWRTQQSLWDINKYLRNTKITQSVTEIHPSSE